MGPCVDMETQFGRFQRLCGNVLPMSTYASQYLQITHFVEEQVKQIHDDVRLKLLNLWITKPTRSPVAPRVSSSTPKDDDLLATKGFKMRVKPNKSSKRFRSRVEKIIDTNEKKRKQKALVEEAVINCMDQMNN
ncbi:hypothetical protein LINPERHAP1_LOCUS40299 [Linum perenne]